jgi:type II secretory pathway pseudopilin PulG
MSRRGDNRISGFMLVEVLVSMIVVALALTTLSAAIVLSRRMEERTDSLKTAIEDAEAATVLLDLLFQNAFAGSNRLAGNWTMDEGGMAFLSIPPAGAGAYGLTRFELKVLKRAEDGESLVVTWRDPTQIIETVEPIIREATEIHLNYLGDFPSLLEAHWYERWGEGGTLPRAVRLTIERRPPGLSAELVFHLRRGQTDPCRIDPSLPGCRGGDG